MAPETGNDVVEANQKTVFIDTSLDTHLATIVSDSDTVLDLKKKIMLEHRQYFPAIGDIKIHSLKVKWRGIFYHLSDSMLVKSAFSTPSINWVVSVDASHLDQDTDIQPFDKHKARDQLALPFVTDSRNEKNASQVNAEGINGNSEKQNDKRDGTKKRKSKKEKYAARNKNNSISKLANSDKKDDDDRVKEIDAQSFDERVVKKAKNQKSSPPQDMPSGRQSANLELKSKKSQIVDLNHLPEEASKNVTVSRSSSRLKSFGRSVHNQKSNKPNKNTDQVKTPKRIDALKSVRESRSSSRLKSFGRSVHNQKSDKQKSVLRQTHVETSKKSAPIVKSLLNTPGTIFGNDTDGSSADDNAAVNSDSSTRTPSSSSGESDTSLASRRNGSLVVKRNGGGAKSSMNSQNMALIFKDTHNVSINLDIEQRESTEFHQAMQFVRRSYLNHALTANPQIYEDLIREFWNSAIVSEDESSITATVVEQEVIISETVIRNSLQLNDEYGVTQMGVDKVRNIFLEMGYEGDFSNGMAKKSLLGMQWRYLMHIFTCSISNRKAGTDEINFHLQNGFVTFCSSMIFNFSNFIFLALIRNINEPKHKFLMYPRFIQMILDSHYPNIPRVGNVLPIKSTTWHTFLQMKKHMAKSPFSRTVTPLFPRMIDGIFETPQEAQSAREAEAENKNDNMEFDNAENVDELNVGNVEEIQVENIEVEHVVEQPQKRKLRSSVVKSGLGGRLIDA